MKNVETFFTEKKHKKDGVTPVLLSYSKA